MFVASIEVGIPNNITIARDPSWLLVEREIRNLDGDTKDGIILSSAGESYMGISGGKHNEYVVAGYLEGFGSFICTSGMQSASSKQVAVNGDCNTYSSANVVTLETVIEAAKVFFESGKLSQNYQWERERRPID